MTAEEMMQENARRRNRLHACFDPESGLGSPGPRVRVTIEGWYVDKTDLYLPPTLVAEPLVERLARLGSVDRLKRSAKIGAQALMERLERLRIRHDFAYWAYKYVYIKPKGGGEDVTLRLTHPQRRFVDVLEEMRQQGRPIRIVLLKARQWGGSTVSQLYMAWLQLTHELGLNSLIIAHQGCASDEIKDMFDRMIERYPVSLLHAAGEPGNDKEAKMRRVGQSGLVYRITGRKCKIKIGTAERPDSCRGGDYNLVHLSEVGMWRRTLGKKPEDIVRSACSGVLYRPMTMIVYESTANGVGNFFHREYMDARDNPRSQFRALFVPWYDIEQNEAETFEAGSAEAFAQWLLDNRDNETEPSHREESGRYLWWLWERGATLEGIQWYITERGKHTCHGSMAAECPTDDTEAFVNSGASVFDKYLVEALRPGCRAPRWVGELEGDAAWGEEALERLRFIADSQGALSVWELPDADTDVRDAYLAVVDIGGRSLKADWSVVVVFDRRPMMRGEPPEVVAQWYGHIDMDLLAWKAAQIAKWYAEALLVIESNTLETHDPQRQVDGDQSQFILNQLRYAYYNLYARRRSSEDVRQGTPVKYGFHTNTSTKPMVISALIKAVRERLYVERDERCLDEMLTYERKANGAFGAILGAHDDLVMTRAIGLHICLNEMDHPSVRSAIASVSVATTFNSRF